MNPLQVMIGLGRKDDELERIIADLEYMKKHGGISEGEEITLATAYQRLDEITRPAKRS